MGGILSMWLKCWLTHYYTVTCYLQCLLYSHFIVSWGQRLRTEAFAAALDIITNKIVHCHPCNKYSSDA